MDDLASQFVAIKQAALQTRVDYAVARKMLDTQQGAGDAAVKLIQDAAKQQATLAAGPGSSGIPGLGEQLDAQA